jgi:branched-chain amino acid transport system permease protein
MMYDRTTGPARSFRIEAGRRASRVAAAAAFVVFLLLALLPAFAGRNLIQDLIFLFYMLALAQCWNLLAGYAGLISVGQQAFVGLGGYILFALTLLVGIDPLLSIPLAGVVCALAALPTALIVFRLRGAYFAIGTWVVAEVFRLLASQMSALGGGSGISLPSSIVLAMAPTRTLREFEIYWLALALTVIVLAGMFALLRSRYGLALTAIRDNELAAQSSGVDIRRLKFLVYVLTACGTGMIGAVIFLMKLRISPDTAFSVNDWTAFVIFIVVIGGIGRIEGPVIGTVIFFALRQTLADLGSLYLLMLGAVAIAMMLFAAKGVWGFVAQRFGWQALPLQRRLVVPDDVGAKK